MLREEQSCHIWKWLRWFIFLSISTVVVVCVYMCYNGKLRLGIGDKIARITKRDVIKTHLARSI